MKFSGWRHDSLGMPSFVLLTKIIIADGERGING
jgi:hypothetical protein